MKREMDELSVLVKRPKFSTRLRRKIITSPAGHLKRQSRARDVIFTYINNRAISFSTVPSLVSLILISLMYHDDRAPVFKNSQQHFRGGTFEMTVISFLVNNCTIFLNVLKIHLTIN